MAPVAAGLANSDTRFHREKWPSSLTRGGHFVYSYAIDSNAQKGTHDTLPRLYCAAWKKRHRRHNGNGAKTTTKVPVPFVAAWVLTGRGSRSGEDRVETQAKREARDRSEHRLPWCDRS